MDENEPETHPLDKDYSAPAPPARPKAEAFHLKLRRIGFFGFAAGFATVFVSIIVVSNSRSGGAVEGAGSSLHRLGMLLILIGGIVIVASYRLPYLTGQVVSVDGLRWWSRRQSFIALVFWNVVGFFAFAGATYLSPAIQSPVFNYIFFNGTLTIASAMMVTLIVWHRGYLRAYAIGVLVALLLNGLSSLFAFGSGFWRGDEGLLLFSQLAVILISGLVCAGYVCLLDSSDPAETRQVKSRRREGVQPID